MIHINATRKDNKIIYLSIKGHANYEESGKDIVCAAISAISVGAINALENPKSFKIKVENGNVEIESIDAISKNDCIVLETMMIQLKTVMESYHERIKVIEKGN